MRFRSLPLVSLAVFAVAGPGCDSLQDILDAAGSTHGKGGGASSGGGGASAEPGTPATPPPAPSCEKRQQGGETSCKPAVVWKTYAREDCQASGLVLSDYSLQGACEKDSSNFVNYVCCPDTAPPTPPSPPAPGTCQTNAECLLVIGGCTKCECTVRSTSESLTCDDDPLAPPCADACAGKIGVCVNGRCAIGSRPQCDQRKQGDAASCRSTSDWKALASSDCEKSGLYLDSYSVMGSCGDGGSQYGQYVSYGCCSR